MTQTPNLEPWRSEDGSFGGKDDAGDHIDAGEGGVVEIESWEE